MELGTCCDTVMGLAACAGENLDFGVGLRLKYIMSKRFWHLDQGGAEYVQQMAKIFFRLIEHVPQDVTVY